MAVDKLSKLRMYAEVRFSFLDSTIHMEDLENIVKELYHTEYITKDELLLKENEPLLGPWEMRVKPQRIFFIMDSCPSYDYFGDVLESHLKTMAKVLTPKEIISSGVQAYYLYPIDSLQDFSEVVTLWSNSYIRNKSSVVGISDLGVNVFFKEESLKVNINCKFLDDTQARGYFPETGAKPVAQLNLLIDLDISTGDPVELKKTLSPALAQMLQGQINEAVRQMEERLGQLVRE